MSEPKFGEWQSIDTAPQDGSEFLARWRAPCHNRQETIVAFYNTREPFVGFHGVNVRRLDGHASMSSVSVGSPETCLLTHWMPLPDPPEDELRAAGHDTHITYDGRMWLVKEPGEAP